jgi:hypothetical protein
MEEALRRLIRRIILPKYTDAYPDLMFGINKSVDKYYSADRYIVFFKLKDAWLPVDIKKPLIDDTTSLMKSLGFSRITSHRASVNVIYIFGTDS